MIVEEFGSFELYFVVFNVPSGDFSELSKFVSIMVVEEFCLFGDSEEVINDLVDIALIMNELSVDFGSLESINVVSVINFLLTV